MGTGRALQSPGWKLIVAVTCGVALFASLIQLSIAAEYNDADPERRNGHRVDEGMLGHYDIEAFRPEPRDLFWQMDQVANPQGKLESLKFDRSVEKDRGAIYGRNTWMLWCAGNEGFWNWMAQHGYGFLDFLQVIDSRKRSNRFRDLGLINQPGMKQSLQSGPWGLYLDTVETPMKDAPDGYGCEYRDYANDSHSSAADTHGRSLKSDGVNPLVYGYPTGILGMRLFPNPAFDEQAKQRWNADSFYDDADYAHDPKIVRPFRVGVSCAFCHVSIHPLNPPVDPENPAWENLSSLIGNQYFRTSAVVGSRASRGNFISHVLRLAQPGTIDASLISTDHINNPNTMNGVFQVPARLARAEHNSGERQVMVAASLSPRLEGQNPVRQTPRILLDGSDSVGAWGALARVYLNIGTFYEEWNECHNPIVGFQRQRPFSIEVCRQNSFYWKVNEKFRVDYLVDFFTWQKPREPWQCSTSPMKLANATHLPEGLTKDDLDATKNPAVIAGRRVFSEHCMVCHSSKQPAGFAVTFSATATPATWETIEARSACELILPTEWQYWQSFKRSPAYRTYVKRATTLADEPGFVDDNFFSTDVRTPVSLVLTNAGRPLGRNALKDWVWSDFSSETYKELPNVGKIDYFNPFSGKSEVFNPPGNGPGFIRPATLVSVWATAPLLHNNALGKYLPDHQAAYRISTAGRLEMFDDAIGKLLWPFKRAAVASGEGGLRATTGAQAWHGSEPDWIFRTDQETNLIVPGGHLRQAAVRLLPAWALWLMDHPGFVPLFLICLLLIARRSPNQWFIFLSCILLALTITAILLLTGLWHVLPWWTWCFVGLLLIAGIAAMAGGKLEVDSASPRNKSDIIRFIAIVTYCVFTFALWQVGVVVRSTINGEKGALTVGPIPKGVPVNALANLDSEAPLGNQLAALRGLLSAISEIRQLPSDAQDYEQKSLQLFAEHAGPGLMRASSCPDMALDRGHLFGESLSDEDKQSLILFLKTL